MAGCVKNTPGLEGHGVYAFHGVRHSAFSRTIGSQARKPDQGPAAVALPSWTRTRACSILTAEICGMLERDRARTVLCA